MKGNPTSPTSDNMDAAEVAGRDSRRHIDRIAKIEMPWPLEMGNYPWKIIPEIVD